MSNIKSQISNKSQKSNIQTELEIRNWKLEIPRQGGAGFTLIELLIVIAITSILSITGIASYITFSRNQAINASVQDVALLLQKGKSYTASQVKQKQGICTSINRPFGGYRVRITVPNTYQLEEICGEYSQAVGAPKKLPEAITFTGESGDIIFQPLTGGIVGPRSIRITGYGVTTTIRIDKSGRITRE